MKKYERVKALVSLDAIAHNFEEMHKNVKEGTKIIMTISGDLPRLPQKKRWNFDMQESPSLS